MFLIFGNPVSHSKSPLMHNYFLKKQGINECYGRFELENGEKINSEIVISSAGVENTINKFLLLLLLDEHI